MMGERCRRPPEAILEVVDHFGMASYETQKVEGHRQHGGVLYRDNLMKVLVDVPEDKRGNGIRA